MNMDEKLAMAKVAMHKKIIDGAEQLPDISDASKVEVMELVLGTMYMMMIEILEDPNQSWSTAARAHTAFIFRELAKDLLHKNISRHIRPMP